MKPEARLVISLWETVRDNGLPADKRAEVAEMMLRAFDDYGFDSSDLAALSHEDDDLANAYNIIFDDDDDDDFDEFDDDEDDED